MPSTETEVRFLEIDKKALLAKLRALGAEDSGEHMLEEVIMYDKALKWRDEQRFIRLRKSDGKTVLTYKHHNALDKVQATEIETAVSDMEAAVNLFEEIGFVAYRHQEKKCHSLKLGDVMFDIDTWPRLPAYVELEGPSLEALEKAAATVELDWSKVVYNNARWVIENVYHIPVGKMRWFTFDRFE